MSQKESNFRYESHLRLIGRHLDLNDLRDLVLFETEGGFIVRALDRRQKTLEALEFPFAAATDLHASAQTSRGRGERVQHVGPLYPTGYEDMLRALGADLDIKVSSDIVILEMEKRLIVKGLEHRDSYHDSAYGDFEMELLAGDVQQMLDNAFRGRSRRMMYFSIL